MKWRPTCKPTWCPSFVHTIQTTTDSTPSLPIPLEIRTDIEISLNYSLLLHIIVIGMHIIGINARNEKPQEIQVRQQNGRLADQQLSEGLKLWQDRVNPRACGAVNSWDFRVM